MKKKTILTGLVILGVFVLSGCSSNGSITLSPKQKNLSATAGQLKSGNVTINVDSDMHDSQKNIYSATTEIKFIRDPFTLSETTEGTRQDIFTEYYDFNGEKKVEVSAESFSKNHKDDTSEDDGGDHKSVDKYLVKNKINSKTMISKIFTLPKLSTSDISKFKKSKQESAIQYTYTGTSKEIFNKFSDIAPLFVGAFRNSSGYLWDYERINSKGKFYYSSKDYINPTSDVWFDMGTYERYLKTKDGITINNINLIYTFEHNKLKYVQYNFKVTDQKERKYSMTMQYSDINSIKPFKVSE